jgi:tetratricopeptide (TPR) repeat protein
MGAVYRVKDRCLGREAALKLTHEEGDPALLERFLREAQITACLDHPGIPPVYEAGKTDSGQHFMVMKVIEGRTLKDHISEARRPQDEEELRELLRALVKVAEAVSYAHSQGIIHRDLKPENIMIGRFGEVLVMDWGLAKDLKEAKPNQRDQPGQKSFSPEELREVGLTLAGSLVGTPGYMAPEQLDGEALLKSDVFALGTILTELLTGRPAIAGGTPLEKISATSRGKILSPRELDPGVSKELDALAQAALAEDVEERLESAEAFVEELKSYLSGQQLSTYDYSLSERFFRWSARRPGLIVSVGLGLLLLSSTVTLYQAFRQSEQEKKRALGAADKATTREKNVKEAFRKVGELEALIQRGAPKEMIEDSVKEALELGGEGYSLLLSTAKICRHINEFVLFSLASKAESQGKKVEAIERYNEIEKYSTTFTWMYNNRGILFHQMGDKEKALKDYSKAIELDSKYATAYYNRGVLFAEIGDKERALKAYNKAIELDSKYAKAYADRGVLFAEIGDKERALKAYNKAIELDSKYATAYYNRGILYQQSGDKERALNDYNKAIELNPKYALAYNNRGGLFQQSGDKERALKDYNKAIELDPKFATAYNNRGNLFRSIGAKERALKDYNKAIELDAKYAMAYFKRGNLFRITGDKERALKDYNKAIELDSKFALAYLNRGVIFLNSDKRRALSNFQAFLRLAPRHPGASKVSALIDRIKKQLKGS